MKHPPIALFGAVMGLAGLGLTSRAAAPLFPGVFQAPAYFTELWVLLGVAAFLALIALYGRKILFHWNEVKQEFASPAQMGFCATLPVGMTLVAGGIAPYLPSAADALWWAGAALLLAMQVWGLRRVLEGGIELAQVNAGWMILFIGGIVLPGSGIALGHDEAARFMFGIGAAATPFVMGLAFYRAAVGAPIAEPLRPSWFILLVPPSLVFAHGAAFFPGFAFLENLYFFGLVLAAGLLLYARRFWRWPFGTPWWAFTFPLDALAFAAVRYAEGHPEAPWKAVAAAAVLAAVFFVTMVSIRSAHEFFRHLLRHGA